MTKQRKTKFFNTKPLGFVHSKETLLPFTSYQNKGKLNSSTQKPFVFCTAKNHFLQIYFSYLGFLCLCHTKTKENQILQHKNLLFSVQRRITSSRFISAILVFPCLDHDKTKENQILQHKNLGCSAQLLPNSFRLS